jgi:hypothetical protein
MVSLVEKMEEEEGEVQYRLLMGQPLLRCAFAYWEEEEKVPWQPLPLLRREGEELVLYRQNFPHSLLLSSFGLLYLLL